ncbi:unnamed protein product [Lactuca saligna]|uniref:Uncharacterized protein n=1 Tax=Lactuca saligna TaxID=75948 RepID=A0AA36EKK1_LACSI|nr:unnamed protein product [Lactuca saligna]
METPFSHFSFTDVYSVGATSSLFSSFFLLLSNGVNLYTSMLHHPPTPSPLGDLEFSLTEINFMVILQ